MKFPKTFKTIVTLFPLPKLLLCALLALTQSFSAYAQTIRGTPEGTIGINNDYIEITKLEISDIGEAQAQNLWHLEIFLWAKNSSKPIARSNGETDSDTYYNKFYWEPKAEQVQRFLDDSNEPYFRYSGIRIEKNSNIAGNNESIGDLIDASSKSVVLRVAFKTNEDDSPVAISQDITIKRITAAVTDAPELQSITANNQTLAIKWNPKSEVNYSDGVARSAPSTLVMVFGPAADSNVDDINTAAKIADTSETGSGDTAAPGGTCRFVPGAVGQECITCADDNAYISDDANGLNALKGSGTNTVLAAYKTADSGSGLTSFSNLENGVTYTVALQYIRGTKVSNCLQGSPVEDLSLLEFNSNEKASTSDPRCFIATAAFGSSLDPYVENLRWLRDQYLLSNPIGQFLVSVYYVFSPKYALMLDNSPELKPWFQALLLPLVGTASAMKFLNVYFPAPVVPMLFVLLALISLLCIYRTIKSLFPRSFLAT